MQIYRSAILANAVTVTASGAEAAYIPRFDQAPRAAVFTLAIATASGSLTCIVQRGRPNIATGDTIFTSSTTYTYDDYLAFTTTTTASTQQKRITIYTTSAQIGSIPTSGVLTAGTWLGPPIGPGPFRLFYVPTGVSPCFTLTCTAEFEF